MSGYPEWAISPETEQERAFLEFHRANPHVLLEILERAERLRKAGRKRIGVKAIVEAMRYDAAVRTDSADYKINNSHVALYARLLLHLAPELSEVVETRRAQVDRRRAA